MRPLRPSATLVIAVLLSAAALTGCDSNDNSGNVSQAAIQQMDEMMTDVFSVLDEIALELEGPTPATAATNPDRPDRLQPAKSNMPTFTCEGGGSVDYDVAESESNFSWNLAFNNCDGIDGTLDFGVESSDPEAQPFVTEFYMDGELNERCTLRYDDWRQTMSFSFDEESQELAGSIVYDGGISATCGNESFSCSYDNVEIDFSDGASGEAYVYEDYCR